MSFDCDACHQKFNDLDKALIHYKDCSWNLQKKPKKVESHFNLNHPNEKNYNQSKLKPTEYNNEPLTTRIEITDSHSFAKVPTLSTSKNFSKVENKPNTNSINIINSINSKESYDITTNKTSKKKSKKKKHRRKHTEEYKDHRENNIKEIHNCQNNSQEKFTAIYSSIYNNLLAYNHWEITKYE